MKRIVICCDGTWNTPDQDDDGVAEPTNVTKLAEAIMPTANGALQPVYYNPGVGTAGSWWRRVWDGYTGLGVARNILDAYSYIIQQYEPGDQLFLFGFSRGAFTVRSLAGLIRSCGILRRDATDADRKAFALYRSRHPATHPREREATLFRRTYAVEDITPIEFIGVWDTVGALGNPLVFGNLSPKNQFHDTRLSTTVRHAYHALGIDEKRRTFKPALWQKQQQAPPDVQKQMEKTSGNADQTLEQMWFCGVHSNIGGGYADAGASNTALDWMIEKARACGLGIDRMSGQADWMAKLRESWRGFYCLLPKYHRPIAAPISSAVTCESLHPSVAKRYETDKTYRPPNLVDYYQRNPH